MEISFENITRINVEMREPGTADKWWTVITVIDDKGEEHKINNFGPRHKRQTLTFGNMDASDGS